MGAETRFTLSYTLIWLSPDRAPQAKVGGSVKELGVCRVGLALWLAAFTGKENLAFCNTETERACSMQEGEAAWLEEIPLTRSKREVPITGTGFEFYDGWRPYNRKSGGLQPLSFDRIQPIWSLKES